MIGAMQNFAKNECSSKNNFAYSFRMWREKTLKVVKKFIIFSKLLTWYSLELFGNNETLLRFYLVFAVLEF